MLISAIIADAWNFQVPAIAEISTAARETCAVLAAVPADADALSLSPPGNTRAQLINDARDFVSWNSRILNAGPITILGEHVAMTNATGLHLHAYLSHRRRGNLALDDLEICPRPRNLSHSHWRDSDFCSCHDSSYKFSSSSTVWAFAGKRHSPPTLRCVGPGIGSLSYPD